jgi:ABC-type hemin transport system substrate-binding protein
MVVGIALLLTRGRNFREMFDMKRIKLSVWFLLLLTLISPSCRKSVSRQNEARHQLPQRIVSISPNVTEILYGVGAWSQVIAVSQYCSYPIGNIRGH